MNMNVKNINEEVLENVSGGRPIGRDGKPITAAEYKNRKNEIHVTSATFTFGTEFTETYVDGIHTTSATF